MTLYTRQSHCCSPIQTNCSEHLTVHQALGTRRWIKCGVCLKGARLRRRDRHITIRAMEDLHLRYLLILISKNLLYCPHHLIWSGVLKKKKALQVHQRSEQSAAKVKSWVMNSAGRVRRQHSNRVTGWKLKFINVYCPLTCQAPSAEVLYTY